MKIRVVRDVLEANEAQARDNRALLDQAGALCVNVMSAPGSGKTSLLEKTLPALGEPCAVLVGDLQTTRDAERLAGVCDRVVQINTGRGCHLTAGQVAEGLRHLDLAGLSFLFIENVGNLVCPAAFDLGEHARAVLLSVPEGDDKVAKYPVLFQSADIILLAKVDLLDATEFDPRRVRQDLAEVNGRAPLLECSVRTGQGLGTWLEWLRARRSSLPRPGGPTSGR